MSKTKRKPPKTERTWEKNFIEGEEMVRKYFKELWTMFSNSGPWRNWQRVWFQVRRLWVRVSLASFLFLFGLFNNWYFRSGFNLRSSIINNKLTWSQTSILELPERIARTNKVQLYSKRVQETLRSRSRDRDKNTLRNWEKTRSKAPFY